MKTTIMQALAMTAAFGLPLSHLEAVNILVDLELSLVTDVSGSVSDSDYRLMMDGYESAFRSPSLVSAIESGRRGAIAVNLVFFDNSASEGIPFAYISNASEAAMFADDILALRNFRPGGGGTTISSGIDLATTLFGQNGYDGTRVVIDVAGDGTGSSPGASRDAALQNGVTTINGIVIGADPSGSLAQFYEDEVIAGPGAFVAVAPTFEDFEPEIQAKIEREVLGYDGDLVDSARILSSTLRVTSISSARATVQGVSDRMFRMRSGVRSEPVVTETPGPVDAKGGMAKAPMVVTTVCPWEVWGKVYWSSQDFDAQYTSLRVPGANFRTLVQADTSIDIYGGAVGVEYSFGPNWAAGFAISASRAEADMTLVGSADIDTVALMPYVSYFKDLGGMGFYADLLYGYGMTGYDTFRLPGPATGSPDGDFQTVEFNTGLNLKTAGLVHGPFGQVRWLDGNIDAYTEVGPGALAFPSTDYKSLATQLGYQASYPMPMGNGTFVPQARAAWEHEFEDDAGNFAGLPQGTIDEDVAVLGLGVGYFMNCGWNVILDYEARLGSESQSHYVGLKAGIEF
jgi:hypothetical protein